MKLFSPTIAKEQFKTKQSNEIVQVAYLEGTLKRLQNQINKANDDFSKLLSDQRELYGSEKLALRKELEDLTKQVQDLRTQRKALMIPVESLKKVVEEMHQQAEARLKTIAIDELEMEHKIEEIKNTLDDVSERKQRLVDEETVWKMKKMGIDEERQQVSDSHVKLNEAIAKFDAEVKQRSKELADGESKLRIEQQRVKEYVEGRTKEIDEEKRSLADRRDALEREFARLKKKKVV